MKQIEFEFLKNGDPKITEKILRSLPMWFGIEEATVSYIEESKKIPMIITTINKNVVGFVSVKNHSPYSSEIYVMGIDPLYHRQSFGKKLLHELEAYLKSNKVEFLQVKTVSEEREDKYYEKTRLFYKSQGFKEIEVFPNLWGPANPCLLLIKRLI